MKTIFISERKKADCSNTTNNFPFSAKFDYDKETIVLIKRFGGYRWDPQEKLWYLTAAALILLMEQPDVRLEFDSGSVDAYKEKAKAILGDAAETTDTELAPKSLIGDESYWKIPASERLRDIKPIAEYDFKTTPYPHQVEGFNLVAGHTKALIADEQGLGKTAESLYISDYYKASGWVKKCLIICGVNSIKYNWLREIQIHTSQQAILIEGSEGKRLTLIQQWCNSDDVYYAIINLEAIRKPSILYALKDKADVIICDEIHKAKNARSQQGRALCELRAKYQIGLTGTPIDDKPEDLYNILRWFGLERRRFIDFRNQYCNVDRWGTVSGYKNLNQLKRQLQSVMIRRKKADVIELPEKIRKTEVVELSKRQKKVYKEMLHAIYYDLDAIMNLQNPLSRVFHLREVTSGIYCDWKENAKLLRVRELIEDEIIPDGKKVIVFSKYEKVALIYKEALSALNSAYITGSVTVQNRQSEVDRFQTDDGCKVCIGTIGAMGTGITLTAASTVIFVDKEWSVTANVQAEDRAHRIGTKEPVTIISMVAKDTIDEHVEEILEEKELQTDIIMEGTDAVLSKYSCKSYIATLLGLTEEELNKYIKKKS